MPDIRSNPEALHTAADDLRSQSDRLASVLAGLAQEATRLREQWDGGAREAYDRAHAEWSKTFGEMSTVLGRIATATDSIAERIVHADDQGASLFTRPGASRA